MADSHGDPTSIEAAAVFFKKCGCDLIIHLGDICDTAHPENTAACLERLAAHGILGIRGNNDHTLLLNQPSLLQPATMAIIRDLPLTRQIESALLTHSLPFASSMGPRCMLETMSTTHIRRFFGNYPAMQLFRGHSHQPEIVRSKQASLLREKLLPGQAYPLGPKESAVITCGALADGFCLIWNRGGRTIELAALPVSG